MRERTSGWIAWSYGLWAERLQLASLIAANIFMWLGSAWDAHWHAAIGRDSFWIPPHVLLYTGGVLAGAMGSLIVCRTGAEVWSANPVVMARTLRSSGYGGVGLGGVLLLLAAGIDEIWHRTIGDYTIWSPPHVLGVAAGIIIGLGTMVAVVHAARRQVLPASWAPGIVTGMLATSLTAVYFGLLPASVMAFLPVGSEYTFFNTSSPYVVGGLTSLMVPVLVTSSQQTSGRRGFEVVAGVGAIMWAIQQVFHMAATPVAAAEYGYVMEPQSVLEASFEFLVLVFMLIPPLAVNRLSIRRPWLVGVLLAILYIVEIRIWLAVLGLPGAIPVSSFTAIVGLGALSAALGVLLGRWLRPMAAIPE